ncbi:MAG: FAD:protein FMN transferase, partial [Deltaproteobacteria bacterium]
MDNQGQKRKSLLSYAIVTMIAALLLALPLYLNRERESVNYTKMLMGTVMRITLTEGDGKRFDIAAEKAFDETKRLEALFTSYSPDSGVSKISDSAGREPVSVSPEVITVLKSAVRAAMLSNGAFDPTVGSLGKVWGYSGERLHVPSKDEIGRVLPLVDYRGIIIDESSNRAGLRKRGMVINLGGIAKGYIVGRAVEALKREGVERGIIHAGGDMTVFQKKGLRETTFKIGIQHPREKRLLGEVYLENGAVSTSGDYERYFIKDGVRYHHILDPSTGFPAGRCRSVTIIAEDPAMADALSTAV